MRSTLSRGRRCRTARGGGLPDARRVDGKRWLEASRFSTLTVGERAPEKESRATSGRTSATGRSIRAAASSSARRELRSRSPPGPSPADRRSASLLGAGRRPTRGVCGAYRRIAAGPPLEGEVDLASHGHRRSRCLTPADAGAGSSKEADLPPLAACPSASHADSPLPLLSGRTAAPPEISPLGLAPSPSPAISLRWGKEKRRERKGKKMLSDKVGTSGTHYKVTCTVE